MEFSSPRFAGDATLLDILNDLDTGLKKLQPGSPADSVKRLQQALWDLSWLKTVEPEMGHIEFVIGIYGPVTTKTVTAYKKHYNIHYHGTIDGYAGPRTMASLDVRCANFDQATESLIAKANALLAQGMALDFPTFPDPLTPQTRPLVKTPGCSLQFWLGEDDQGHIYFRDGVGAYEAHGRIDEYYRIQGGGPTGQLGFPVSDQETDDVGHQRNRFEGGEITLDPVSGDLTRNLNGVTPDLGDPSRHF